MYREDIIVLIILTVKQLSHNTSIKNEQEKRCVGRLHLVFDWPRHSLSHLKLLTSDVWEVQAGSHKIKIECRQSDLHMTTNSHA